MNLLKKYFLNLKDADTEEIKNALFFARLENAKILSSILPKEETDKLLYDICKDEVD